MAAARRRPPTSSWIEHDLSHDHPPCRASRGRRNTKPSAVPDSDHHGSIPPRQPLGPSGSGGGVPASPAWRPEWLGPAGPMDDVMIRPDHRQLADPGPDRGYSVGGGRSVPFGQARPDPAWDPFRNTPHPQHRQTASIQRSHRPPPPTGRLVAALLTHRCRAPTHIGPVLRHRPVHQEPPGLRGARNDFGTPTSSQTPSQSSAGSSMHRARRRDDRRAPPAASQGPQPQPPGRHRQPR